VSERLYGKKAKHEREAKAKAKAKDKTEWRFIEGAKAESW
jgi:hypothetical protein